MRLLVIDDEVKFVNALGQTLVEQQLLVDVAHDGLSGLDIATTGSYDLIIVDVMLPGLSGFDIVRTLREQGDSTPILLLTARDSVDDRVEGLDCGADDYLVKPFATKELLARVRALTRRSGEVGASDTLSVGEFCLDLTARTISFCNVKTSLSAKEFQLLEVFMRNPNQVLPKVLILDRIWGYDTDADVGLVEIYVHMLRKKLAAELLQAGREPTSIIETVRGIGYVFRGMS